MKGWILRSLAAVLLSMVTAIGLVSPASATPRATLKAAAQAVAYEQVGGPKYGDFKDTYPRELNWTKDGCSVPKAVLAIRGVSAVVKAYGKVFERSCDRHDFGYRNFGKNTKTPGVHPKFSPTQATKDKIDNRFRSNMKIQCAQRYDDIWDIPAREACKKAADVFYLGVHLGGGGAFFG